MIPLMLLTILGGLSRLAVRRARAAGVAGRAGVRRAWRAASYVALCVGLAVPFYTERVSADFTSATIESLGQEPRLDGGGVDVTMDRLRARGLDAVVTLTEVYAAGSTEAAIEHFETEIAPKQHVVSRWLDRGRFADNFTTMIERSEQRALPLLLLRAHAVKACDGGADEGDWERVTLLLEEDSEVSKAAPVDLLDAARTEVEDRCADVLDVVDREVVLADIETVERRSTGDYLLDAVLLRYEPGR